MQLTTKLGCVALIAGSAIAPFTNTTSASAAPSATTSRYMKTSDTTTLYNEGCAQGHAAQDGIIVLDFGSPSFNGSTYGTLLFGSNTFRSIAQIEKAAESFLTGYWNCSP